MTLVRDGSVRYVTNSEIQTFKRCKRKWWLAYVRRLALVRQQVTGVRGLGTRMHGALAGYYQPVELARDAFDILETQYLEDRAMLEAREDSVSLDELEKDMAYARIMLEGYFQYIAEEGVDIGLEVIASEAEVSATLPFETHLGVPVRLLGRLDVRVKRELDGARMFLDHKNVGSFSQATAMLHMDQQMQMYTLLEMLEQLEQGAAFEETTRCDGGTYNMLRRVKRTAKAKPPFYAREDVHFNVTQLRNFYRHTMSTIRDIIRALEDASTGDPQDLFPPSPRGDCTWSCDYVHVCPMFDDGSHAEGFLTAVFESYDPLDRYIESDGGSEGETE